MDRSERFIRIIQILNAGRAVPRRRFLEDLEVSLPTFKRDIEYLRDRLHAPIIWDRNQAGYVLDRTSPVSRPFHLPGLWFNASEVLALLTMAQLLESVQPGLLAPHIAPLRQNIRSLLGSQAHSAEDIECRIRLLPMAARSYELKCFEVICVGMLSRKRLLIRHYSRAEDATTERQVSPQRLIYYRDNWYLDTWCHGKKGIRTFSVDTIDHVELLREKARNVSDRDLDEQLTRGYGIFAGTPKAVAILRFTPKRARWVSHEKWHPEQKSYFEDSGAFILEIPYSDDTELIMDIMKFGPDVEVMGPNELKESVTDKLRTALRQYRQ